MGFFPPQPWHITLKGKQTHVFVLRLQHCTEFVAQGGWLEGKAVHFPGFSIKPASPQHISMACQQCPITTRAQTWQVAIKWFSEVVVVGVRGLGGVFF